MKKVEIKRVKRKKKAISTGEKIMAGLGVGSAFFGAGAGTAAASNAPQTQFVRTMPNTPGSSRTAVQDKLKQIFGENLGAIPGLSTQNQDQNSLLTLNQPSSADVNSNQDTTQNLLTLGSSQTADPTSAASPDASSSLQISDNPAANLTATNDANNSQGLLTLSAQTTDSQNNTGLTGMDTGNSDNLTTDLTMDAADSATPLTNPVSISTTSLPDAVAGTVYVSPQLQATGGSGNYQWTISSSALPPGLTLDPSGTITGTPTTAGSYTFTVQAIDASSNAASPQLLTLNVDAQQQTLNSLNNDTVNSGLTGLLSLNQTNSNQSDNQNLLTFNQSLLSGQQASTNNLSVSSQSLSLVAGTSGTITVSSSAGALDAANMQISLSSSNVSILGISGGTITVMADAPGMSILSITAMGQTLTVPVNVTAAPMIGIFGSAGNLLSLNPVSGSLQAPLGTSSPSAQQNQGENTLLSVSQNAPLQSTGTTTVHTVKGGDTLWGIAQQYYGDGSQWRKILSANPGALSNPGNTRTLKIGVQLNIPSLN